MCILKLTSDADTRDLYLSYLKMQTLIFSREGTNYCSVFFYLNNSSLKILTNKFNSCKYSNNHVGCPSLF